jgi:phosphoglycolate phosphatase-like HAD superfamily hydrolase
MSTAERLVLFDIDGTLMSGAGAGRRALQVAMEGTFGPMPHIAHWTFAGKTDPQIYRELTTEAGIAADRQAQHMTQVLDLYLDHLEAEILSSSACHLKPGIAPLLEALQATPGVTLGLLTGNLVRGARVKTDRFGLSGYFRLGAYGSDHAVRRELPPIAVERARALTGRDFRGKEIVIIGDTEHDIRCGSALGVKAIAVATGQYSVDELTPHGADHVFADLGDTERALAAILG